MIKLYMKNRQFFVEKDGKVKRFDNLADAWAYAFKFRYDTNEEIVNDEKEKEKMNNLLSVEALMWLKSVDFTHRSHEERMTLIAAAKILFPDDEEKKQ